MDIFSAAQRLSRPFELTVESKPEDLPIGAHGVIGDGHTAALVRVDGAIDWLCMPRFDSPSVFAGLLDAERGGSMTIRPRQAPFSSLQRYDPDTNVLETLFRVPGQGVLRLIDYMPWTDDPRASIHEIHRRVECIEGDVEVEAIFDPRFDFGRGKTEIIPDFDGLLAKGGGTDRLTLSTDAGVAWNARPEGGSRALMRLSTRQSRWFILSWGSPNVQPVAAFRPYEHLRVTRKFWRAWSHRLTYDGPARHHVLRSALLLKLLSYSPSGAMVAAPSTSLPEWIGGRRNWDYRFAWIRDAALGVRAMNLIGYEAEAREFFYFIRDCLDRDEFRIMSTVDGQPVPEEQILSHLRGYRGSAPVRIGNGAREQLQLDNPGYLLDAAHTYEHGGGSLTLRVWRHLAHVVEQLRTQWRSPDQGIWEPRDEPQHNVNSKLMAWVAFDRAARISDLFGGSANQAQWRNEADEARHDLLTRGLDPTGRYFTARYGGQQMDSTLLLLSVYDFLPGNDPRVLATIDRTRAELEDRGFLYRYHGSDGVEGEEGAFLLCGFWLAEALALAGRIEEAQEVFDRHANVANHVGLLSEEVDPSTGGLLGNFPQGFSHMGMINAAARIDLALRVRDEHSSRKVRFASEPSRDPNGVADELE